MTDSRVKSRRRNTSLKQKFGLNYNQYQKMLEQQNHSCYICKEPETVTSRILSVDHDHETNKVRGLLCTNCNTALGKFKDNISFLKRAVEYLQRQYDVPRVEETVYFIPHVDRPNWRRIVHTPDGVFTSNEAASKHFNVHEATMLAWCGLNKKKTHLKKEGFVSEKLYISLKEAKEKFNVKD